MSEIHNPQKSIARLTGHCIGYNFKSECESTSCESLHSCLHHNEPQQHKTMLCIQNPNKWKKFQNKSFNKARNARGRGRGRFN